MIVLHDTIVVNALPEGLNDDPRSAVRLPGFAVADCRMRHYRTAAALPQQPARRCRDSDGVGNSDGHPTPVTAQSAAPTPVPAVLAQKQMCPIRREPLLADA